MALKAGINLTLVKSTEKAKLFQKDGIKKWVPNRAIVDMKYRGQGCYTVVVEDWFETPLMMFQEVSLVDLLQEKPPPDLQFITGIDEKDFPADLVQIQREAVAFSVRLRRALIWLWTGCGKTKIGIDIANILYRHNKIKRLYWITPQIERAEEQLRSSFARWLTKDLNYKVVSINWFSYHADTTINQDDVVIIDECHRVKNGIVVNNESPDCKLSDNIRLSLFNAGYVYGLTATSCLNGVLDLFGIFYCIDKKIIIEEGKKARHYLNMKANKVTGVKSMLNFINSVSPYIFHRNKQDYDNRTPITKEKILRLNAEQSGKMNQLYSRTKSIKEPSIVDSYCRMIECMYRSGGDTLKINAIKEIITAIPAEDQAIIFGFTVNGKYSDISLIRQAVKETGATFLELHGERSDEDNALAIHKFRNGGCRILIASYGCGCEMLDFPNANHVILFGHSLNPIHRFQGIGRVDRLVQKKQVYVYPVYVINSVEGYLNQLYCRKLDMATDLSVYMKKDEQKLLNNEIPQRDGGGTA